MAQYPNEEEDYGHRRFSSLGHSVGRVPLQDLNVMSCNDEDATIATASTSHFTAMTKRRVSFNNKFNIKEFNAEERTVHVMHAPEYEEPLYLSSDSSFHPNNNSSVYSLSHTEVINRSNKCQIETVKIYSNNVENVDARYEEENYYTKNANRQSIDGGCLFNESVNMSTTMNETRNRNVIPSFENSCDLNNSMMDIDETNVNVQNVLSNSSRMMYADDERDSGDESDMSMTKAIQHPSIAQISEVDNSLINDTNNMSNLQGRSSGGNNYDNNMSSRNVSAMTLANDTINMSVTKVLPAIRNDIDNVSLNKGLPVVRNDTDDMSISRRRTSVGYNNSSNFSTTKGLLSMSCNMSSLNDTKGLVNDTNDMSISKGQISLDNNNTTNISKRNVSAIVNDTDNLSVTKVLPVLRNGINDISISKGRPSMDYNNLSATKGHLSMSYDTNSMNVTRNLGNCTNDMSITRGQPSICIHNASNSSITEILPTKNLNQTKDELAVSNNSNNMSVTRGLPSKNMIYSVNNKDKINLNYTNSQSLSNELNNTNMNDVSEENTNKDLGYMNHISSNSEVCKSMHLESENNEENDLMGDSLQYEKGNMSLTMLTQSENELNDIDESYRVTSSNMSIRTLQTMTTSNDEKVNCSDQNSERGNSGPVDLCNINPDINKSTDLIDENTNYNAPDWNNSRPKRNSWIPLDLTKGKEDGDDFTESFNGEYTHMETSDCSLGNIPCNESSFRIQEAVLEEESIQLNLIDSTCEGVLQVSDINKIKLDKEPQVFPESRIVEDNKSEKREITTGGNNINVDGMVHADLNMSVESIVNSDGVCNDFQNNDIASVCESEKKVNTPVKGREGEVFEKNESFILDNEESPGVIKCSSKDEIEVMQVNTEDILQDCNDHDQEKSNRDEINDASLNEAVNSILSTEKLQVENTLLDKTSNGGQTESSSSANCILNASNEQDTSANEEVEDVCTRLDWSRVTLRKHKINSTKERSINCNNVTMSELEDNINSMVVSDVQVNGLPLKRKSLDTVNSKNDHDTVERQSKIQKCSDTHEAPVNSPSEVDKTDNFHMSSPTNNTHYTINLKLSSTGTSFTEHRLRDCIDSTNDTSEVNTNSKIILKENDMSHDKEAYYNHLIAAAKSKMVFTTEFRSHSCCTFKILSDSLYAWYFFDGKLILSAKLNVKNNTIVERTKLQTTDDFEDKFGGCLYLFARKVEEKFKDQERMCNTPNNVSNLLMNIINHIEKNENFFSTITMFFARCPINVISNNKIKYDLISSKNLLWCEVIVDSSIIWRKLSDSEVSVNNVIGRVNFDIVKHILRLSSYSTNHYISFVKKLEEYKRNNIDMLMGDQT